MMHIVFPLISMSSFVCLVTINARTFQVWDALRLPESSARIPLQSKPRNIYSHIISRTSDQGRMALRMKFDRQEQMNQSKLTSTLRLTDGAPNNQVITSRIRELVSSKTVFIFSWTFSPCSAKAKRSLDDIMCKYAVVELDEPWNERDQIRAVLNQMMGSFSIPHVWINCTYIGGYDEDSSECAQGLVRLTLAGKLRSLLIDANALSPGRHDDISTSNQLLTLCAAAANLN